MTGPDSFYTPPSLATKLLSYVERPATTVADFCVGEGNLLIAAEKKFGDIECYGIDISEDVINTLRVEHPYWRLAVANFVDGNHMHGIAWMSMASYDLILMNPPFTCKGSIIHNIEFEGSLFHVSTAMFFLLHALPYMRPDGHMYAILPITIVRSQKDARIWSYLEQNYNACILEEYTHAPFNKCTPNILFVHLSKRYKHPQAKNISYSSTKFKDLPVQQCIRGSISATNISQYYSNSSLYFIHTTSLQQGKIIHAHTIKGIHATISKCYGVVIPRVGKPNVQKVALLNPNRRYVLSDCVIAILTDSASEASLIKNTIVNNWDSFSQIYTGTGAQYTTMGILMQFLGFSR